MSGESSVAPDAPVLSVIVTIVDGGDVLRRFLDALLSQVDAPTMEVFCPYDATNAEVALLQAEYPRATFLNMGAVDTFRPISTAAGQHELYDRRRAAGLAPARGELIAILEDRAPPRPDWAKTMQRLHAELPHAAIGGPIECASTDVLNWCFYAADFTRYELPFESGPRRWVSDVNVCYKRRAMDSTRHVWRERFNEALVHWTLLDQGETLFLTSEAVVDYTTPYRSLAAVLPVRFHWGRLFGQARTTHIGAFTRLAYIAAGPLIPLRLFARHGVTQFRKGHGLQFVKASPVMFTMLVAWASGEVWGYITRKP